MKPILLHGHERAITMIKYSREGDLLFSCSKDPQPNVWFAANGERLGTLNGHQGAVWCIDVDWDTTRVVTGGGDNSVRLWDVSNGKEVSSLLTKSAVRSTVFSYSARMIMYATDKQMGHQSEIHIVDTRDLESGGEECKPVVRFQPDSPVRSALFGPLDQFVITGHEDGSLVQWDVKTGRKMNSIKEHTKKVNDLQFSKEETMFITASSDCTAKLFDTDSLDHMKTYKTERPVNSASISPIRDHVVLGGGQEAMTVTTTTSRAGKFEARFFHLIFEEEFGRVKGHFGPINSLAFHPDGKSYASGGEDGYVRIHQFDPAYYAFEMEY